MNCGGQAGFLPQAGSLKDTHLKVDALGIVFVDKAGVFHESSEGDPTSEGGLVTGVVNEVNRARLGHEIDGREEDDEEGGGEDMYDVELKGLESVEDLIRTEVEEVEGKSGHYGDESEGEDVVDEVLVAEFHVLELDGGREVG